MDFTTTQNAPNAVRLSRDGDGRPAFEVRATWGDFTLVRAVRVPYPRNDFRRHLMRAIASDGSPLTNRGLNEGVILAGTHDRARVGKLARRWLAGAGASP